jgi:hypothetical protein
VVKALRYKLAGLEFDSRWCHWNISVTVRTMAPGSTQPLTEMSTRLFPGGKGGRCVKLTTLPPTCAVVVKSGNLNFLEPSGPLQACNGTALPSTFTCFCYQKDERVNPENLLRAVLFQHSGIMELRSTSTLARRTSRLCLRNYIPCKKCNFSHYPLPLVFSYCSSSSSAPLPHSKASARPVPCVICGGRCATRTGFFHSTSVFPCQDHATSAPYLIFMLLKDKLAKFVTTAVRVRAWANTCWVL